MFVEALFISSQAYKQPRCSSMGEQIGNLWYVQIISFTSKKKQTVNPWIDSKEL